MEYWIIKDEATCGPYDIEQLAELNITADTPVWHDGLTDWVSASEVEELACLLYTTVPSVPEEPVQESVLQQTPCEVITSPEAAQRTVISQNTEHPYVVYVPADAIPAGYVPVVQAEVKCPPTYLPWAIICTIVCFLPFGICAIIFSTKVKRFFKAGDYVKASKMSERTALFIILSLVAWLIWMPFSVVISML